MSSAAALVPTKHEHKVLLAGPAPSSAENAIVLSRCFDMKWLYDAQVCRLKQVLRPKDVPHCLSADVNGALFLTHYQGFVSVWRLMATSGTLAVGSIDQPWASSLQALQEYGSAAEGAVGLDHSSGLRHAAAHRGHLSPGMLPELPSHSCRFIHLSLSWAPSGTLAPQHHILQEIISCFGMAWTSGGRPQKS